jgi:hypothetical protein
MAIVASTAASEAALPSVARKILSNRLLMSIALPFHHLRRPHRVLRPPAYRTRPSGQGLTQALAWRRFRPV